MTNVSRVMLMIAIVVFCVVLAFFIGQTDGSDLERRLLKPAVMPTGWKVSYYVSPPALPTVWAQDGRSLVLEHDQVPEVASHTVYRYANSILARFFFRFNSELYFPSGLGAWADLAGASSWTLSGDAKIVQCTGSFADARPSRCTAAIQCGSLLADVSAPVGPGIMSEDQFRTMVEAASKYTCTQTP